MIPPTDSAPVKVRISDPSHPHYPKHGELTGEIISLFGKPMARMRFDESYAADDDCYVSHGQVSRIPKHP